MTWIKTYEGNKFDYLNSKPEDVSLIDISHALSKEQRFGGHLEKNWSVGQHVLLVRKLVLLDGGAKEQAFIALHHDDPEAYMKDIPTPLKNLLPDYQAIYKRIATIIGTRFQVSFEPLESFVKEKDWLAAQIEDILLFSSESKGIKWHDFTVEKYLELCKVNFGLDKYISRLFSLTPDETADLYRKYHYNRK